MLGVAKHMLAGSNNTNMINFAATGPIPQHYSVNGIDWYSSNLAFPYTTQCCCFGDDEWVALGTVAFLSPNGKSWGIASLPVAANPYDFVVYANNRYVGLSGRTSGAAKGAYSDDGRTWIAMTPAVGVFNWGALTYGASKYLASSSAGPSGRYSADGITWASTTIGNPADTTGWTGLQFGNSIFAAVKAGKTTYSADGLSWTWQNVTDMGGILVFGNGMFVSNSQNGDEIFYSSDAITWTPITLPGSPVIARLLFSETVNMFFAYTTSTDAFFSSDGITWTPATLNTAISPDFMAAR